jgi:hypothetical protein
METATKTHVPDKSAHRAVFDAMGLMRRLHLHPEGTVP